MKTLFKWVALGYFALAVLALTPKPAVAQEDAAQPGFDDPTAMAAPHSSSRPPKSKK